MRDTPTYSAKVIDGAVGVDADALPLHGRDRVYWTVRCAEIERIASDASPPPRGEPLT